MLRRTAPRFDVLSAWVARSFTLVPQWQTVAHRLRFAGQIMAAFVVSAPVAVKAAAPVRVARSAAPASVATRRSVRMQASYKVTLVTPEGTKEITCADDVYVLDAAEVRLVADVLFSVAWSSGRGSAKIRHMRRLPPSADSFARDSECRRRASTCRTPAARAPAPLAPARWRCALPVSVCQEELPASRSAA